MGYLEQAESYYQQSLKVVKAIKKPLSEAYTLNNLGFLYSSKGQYAKAFEFYQQALKMPDLVKDPLYHSIILANTGEVLVDLNRIDEAEQYLRDAISKVQSFKAKLPPGTKSELQEKVEIAHQALERKIQRKKIPMPTKPYGLKK